jgi:hypothetical protein
VVAPALGVAGLGPGAPPKVSAAPYQAAALIPEVTLMPNATDAIGRHGVAVAQTAEGIRTELTFSKTSLKLIGERTIVASIGISTDATAIISQGLSTTLTSSPQRPRPRRQPAAPAGVSTRPTPTARRCSRAQVGRQRACQAIFDRR